MHVRGQIREAVRALLITVPGLEDGIFFDSDEVPEDLDLPCAVVSLGNESIEHESLGGSSGATLAREAELNVDLLYRARKDALLAAEDYAAAIEAKIATSATLLTLARSWFPQQLTVTRDESGAQTIVQLRLQWLVTYSTNERDATVAIP